MAQKFGQSVVAFAIVLIGLAATVYAAGEAYGGADTSVGVINDVHPVVEQLLAVLPYAILLLAAFGVISAVGWMLTRRPTGGTFR